MKRFVIGAILLALFAVGTLFGIRQYKEWRQGRVLKSARAYIESRDFKNASLCARQAVRANPNDAEACRVLADLAEMAGATNALFWRQRVLELSPASENDRILLARTALVLGRPLLARDALRQVSVAMQKDVVFHKLSGNACWELGELARAEEHFVEASRIEPANLVQKMNLQLVRLASTNENTASQARKELVELASLQEFRPGILRQLCTDALRRKDRAAALRHSEELINADALLPDKLRHLALLLGDSQAFEKYCLAVEGEVRTNGFAAAALARWMTSQNLAARAGKFLETLPETAAATLPCLEAKSEALLSLGQWNQLEEALEKRSWGRNEHARQLLLARVARERSSQSGTRSHWLKSLKAAAGSVDRLAQLARVTASWQWTEEFHDALAAIVSQHPEQKWAAAVLGRTLHQNGKTQALQNLFAKTIEREPTNFVAKSNFATLGLLLDGTDEKAHRMAQEAFQGASNDPYVTATLALSLHFQQRTSDALELMQKLKPEELRQPAIAAWFGFLLVESGHKNEAAEYFALGTKAELLPEERQLIASARKKL